MRELIYYPGFEVHDVNWLKFALLYLDKLDPIIPISGDQYLTELYRQIQSESDLIRKHRPRFEEGFTASDDAIEVVGKILSSPERYERVFGTKDVVMRWRGIEQQSYTLFREKFTDSWEHFCCSNGIAHRTLHGIAVPRELGFLYMSILAQAVADARGIAQITDYAEWDRFSILVRTRCTPVRRDTAIAQSVIRLKLPKDLDHISVADVIAFRNRTGFKKRLHAFHNALETYIAELERGEASADFFTAQEGIIADFTDEIVRVGAGVASFGLGFWFFLGSDVAAAKEYVKELAAGTTLTVGSVIAIRNAWEHTRTKRYTRKYLATLNKLKPAGRV